MGPRAQAILLPRVDTMQQSGQRSTRHPMRPLTERHLVPGSTPTGGTTQATGVRCGPRCPLPARNPTSPQDASDANLLRSIHG